MSERERALVSQAVGRAVVADVAGNLNAAGIRLMPLKGVWLQACVYGPDGERSVTDVDVLVPEPSYDRAVELLQGHGWQLGERAVSEDVLRHPRWELPLDLHRRLFTPGAFRLPTAELFARGKDDSEVFGAPVRLPDPADVIAHLVGHFVKSRGRPEEVSKMRDFVALVQRFPMPPERCADWLEAAGMSRAARFTFAELARTEDGRFYADTLAALRPDPVGTALVALSRRLASQSALGSPIGALPGFLVERSVPAGARVALSRILDRVLRDRAPSGDA